MSDIEIRLHCIEAAEGDLGRAKEIFQWVMGRVDPPTTAYPSPGLASTTASGRAGLGYGIAIGSAAASGVGTPIT